MPYVVRTADFKVVLPRLLVARRRGTHGDARGYQAEGGVARIAVIAVIVLLSGCSVLGDRRVAAGCQIADGVTTYHALTHGAVEGNTLLAGLSPGAILLIKFAFAYAIWKAFPDYEKASSGDKFATGTITIFGCVPAANNVQVIRTLR